MMSGDEVYEQLAAALGRLGGGFPRTATNVEVALLRRIFTLDEARLASQLSAEMVGINELSIRLGLAPDEARSSLMQLARRGMVWYDKQGGRPRFRLAPFVVGIYEAQLERMDAEMARLFEEYMAQGGAAGIMGRQPAPHRVLPAPRAVKSEWVLPYEDVRSLLSEARSFRVRDCICRTQQRQLGQGCDAPLRSCLTFSTAQLPPTPNDLSCEEALALLEETEEHGLVHTVSNVAEGLSYVCNCCGCCCALLRGINEYGVENSVAQANYYATVDAEVCRGCGQCLERCQVHAVALAAETATVDRRRCLGCGLCVTSCPSGAIALHLKPAAEIVEPPLNYAEWERRRLAGQ